MPLHSHAGAYARGDSLTRESLAHINADGFQVAFFLYYRNVPMTVQLEAGVFLMHTIRDGFRWLPVIPCGASGCDQALIAMKITALKRFASAMTLLALMGSADRLCATKQ